MEILKRPILNEKFAELNKLGVYGFVVDRRANKIEIKKAVEGMFNVNVNAVRTLIAPAKNKARMTKKSYVQGRRAPFKKAYVTLAQGEVIDFYGDN